MFANKKREGIDTFVCAVSLYVTETPKSLNQGPGTPISHNTFWHCHVWFCWTTFLKTAVYSHVHLTLC